MICNNCSRFIGSGMETENERNQLFQKYYYQNINIYSTDDIWNMIKNDKSFNKTITKKDFLDWLLNQEQHQTQTIKYNKSAMFPPIIACKHSYQMDLMFLKQFASLNDRYDSIFNIIEITTKKVYSYPLKYKNSTEVFENFMKFYNSIDKKLNSIEMDGGGEFSKIIQFCKENDIHYIIYNGEKNSMAIVERFNRTLRDYITRNCPNGRWIDKLNDIVYLYNNKKSSSTNETPENLENDEKKQNSYRETLIGKLAKYQVELSKFKIGDKVRIYKNSGPFEKGGGNFSKGIHEITNIKGLSMYIDNNNNKRYKVYQVMKVGENIPPPNNIKDDEMDKLEKVKKNYKTALKLAKEQTTRKNVHDVNIDLQNNLNDETLGRGKREKKQVDRLTY